MLRRLLTFTFLILPTFAFAGPPFVTEDPGILDVKHWNLYFFEISAHTLTENTYALPGMEVDYGLIPNVEVDFTVAMRLSHGFEDDSVNAYGFGDIQTVLKVCVLQESKYLPQVSLTPVYYLPTGSVKKDLGNGRPWMQLPITAAKNWGAFQIYGSGGYGINGAPEQYNLWYGGMVAQYEFNDFWALGAEIFATEKQGVGDSGFTLINVGGGYSFNKNLALLFSIGHTIGGQRLLATYLGLSLVI